MKEFWNTIQLVFAAVGGWLGYFLGGCDGLLYALIAFVAIDYITGYSAAAKNGEWSSKIAREGLWHKTGCIFAVLMSTMWLLSSVFAREYMGHDGHERLYQVFFMCVLSALIGQCYAGSMVTLYVFYELMTLLSAPMRILPTTVAVGATKTDS